MRSDPLGRLYRCVSSSLPPLAGLVVRWNRLGGKKIIRPLALHADGWRVGAMPGLRPLYRLAELAGAAHVFVCEGEPAADAARSLGCVATTSVGGCKAAALTDWSPLAGKTVTILPDNDDPGRAFARQVATILSRLNPPALVSEVNLPGLAVHGDMVDWIAAHGNAAEPESMRIELLAVAATAQTPAVINSAAGTGPRVVPELIELDKVRPTPVDWLWPGRFPLGRLTVVAGRPGAGKTFVASYLAAVTSTGGHWPDGTTAPLGRVLLLNAEDDAADTLVPRLAAAGADLTRIRLLRGARRIDPSGRENAMTPTNDELLTRLANIETLLASLVEQRTVKEWYTTAEVATRLGKAEFTVREWCRLGRVHAAKKKAGRGTASEWIVSHAELTRVRNEGLLPDPHTTRPPVFTGYAAKRNSME